MPTLTDDELRAIAYYAVGVSSEGKDRAYRLSFAGNHLHEKDGTVQLEPIGNSGYSVGEMQTDFGQHPDDAQALVAAYQAWATANHPGSEAGWVLSDAQQAKQTALLQRDGHHIRDANFTTDDAAYLKQHGTHMPSRLLLQTGHDIDPAFKSHLETFLATDAGKSFVNGLDAKRIDGPDGLMATVVIPLRKTESYKNANPEEQAKVFAVTVKAENQNPRFARQMLDDMRLGNINSLAEISAEIGSSVKRDPHHPNKPTYMETGRDAARAGAEVFNALQNAGKDDPLHAAWQRAMANPPVSPTALNDDPSHPHLADEYAMVKSLFVDPARGQAFVAALNRGASYNYGDPARVHSRGFYAEGHDFLQWDRDGHGRAFINGQWSAFSRDGVSLTRNPDNTLDVEVARNDQTERLLHVTHPHLRPDARHVQADALHFGARGEAVETLQANLARLGYAGRDGHALRADGDFGRVTLLAVEAFQRDHGLAVDGKVGPHTRTAIQTATEAHWMEAAVACNAPAPLRTFSDPAHPQHALHTTLQGLLPATTTEARLAQATTACHLAGINKPEDLSGIYSGGNGKILFTTNSLFASIAEMDVGKPAPAVQQSLQQVKQFDQQQKIQTQRTMQQQPVQAPVIYP